MAKYCESPARLPQSDSGIGVASLWPVMVRTSACVSSEAWSTGAAEDAAVAAVLPLPPDEVDELLEPPQATTVTASTESSAKTRADS